MPANGTKSEHLLLTASNRVIRSYRYQRVIVRTVMQRTQRKPILNFICPALMLHGNDVCSIQQIQLYAAHATSVTICSKDADKGEGSGQKCNWLERISGKNFREIDTLNGCNACSSQSAESVAAIEPFISVNY